MKGSVGIQKIVLRIGDQKVNLSLAEARALRDLLQDMLGDAEITVVLSPAPNYISYSMSYPAHSTSAGSTSASASGGSSTSSSSATVRLDHTDAARGCR